LLNNLIISLNNNGSRLSTLKLIMKNSAVLLMVIFCFIISCKKEEPKVMNFLIELANKDDSIYIDSVAYAVINYSDHFEFKDTSDYNNPEVFSHTLQMEKPFSITLPADYTLTIKKFDLVSKSGNVLFYIPYKVQYYYVNGIKYQGMSLPFSTKADNAGYVMMVTKK